MDAYTQYRIYQEPQSEFPREKAEIIDELNKFLYDMQVKGMEILYIQMLEPFKMWGITYHVKPTLNEEAIEDSQDVIQDDEDAPKSSTESIPEDE